MRLLLLAVSVTCWILLPHFQIKEILISLLRIMDAEKIETRYTDVSSMEMTKQTPVCRKILITGFT
jgi:hypothetical protein